MAHQWPYVFALAMACAYGSDAVRSAASQQPADPSSNCTLGAASGELIATAAVNEAVDPAHAPRPMNDSERLVFRQLYETLVQVDCNGRVQPGLAASWQMEADGVTWLLTLREDAQFSDHTAVTAATVVAAWSRTDNDKALRPEVLRHIRSVTARDDRTLVVVFPRRQISPAILSDRDLAVARATAESPWPLGTRGVHATTEASQRGQSTITLDWIDARPPAATPRAVRVLVAPGRDARDFLDGGVDLVVTRDVAALTYAETLTQFDAPPLSWNRTHVFVSRYAATSGTLSSQGRQAFADDAVRGEARGAEAPYWWQAVSECPTGGGTAAAPATASSGRIVYPRGDAVARDLAERIVGLVNVRSPIATTILDALVQPTARRTLQRAVGLDAPAMTTAMTRGDETGYVVALDSRPRDACATLKATIDQAPWLSVQTVAPLVDTRLRAIVRKGRSGLMSDWSGDVSFSAPDAR